MARGLQKKKNPCFATQCFVYVFLKDQVTFFEKFETDRAGAAGLPEPAQASSFPSIRARNSSTKWMMMILIKIITKKALKHENGT